MDVLADALRHIRLRSKLNGRLEGFAPWGIRVLARDVPTFYVITRGNCVLEAEGTRRMLSPGDFVFILGGVSYVLKDSVKTRPLPAEAVYAYLGGRCGGTVRAGGSGPLTTVICGTFEFEGASPSPLLASLPRLLHVKAEGDISSRWIDSAMQLMAQELEAEQPGYEAVASRLADMLFVQALRTHVASQPAKRGGWLGALTDPQVGTALQHLHEKPEAPWTVEGLARVANMSRSVFAARFKALVGDAPLTYLTRWRIHRAAQIMALAPHHSTSEVARQVGYETDSAFVKAFRRHVGETPGTLRRRLRERAAETKPQDELRG
ncbi:AraC family transcriptional regulator [Corallococcus sp. H22C18031201]|uniref:AraC family transcriptional regulator n=1 Tax=Citreicoccus inhibens TaxID=2849499 RepID=UPI000E72B897|nr:AraC family transcriptional regulator [Citreicoccus inhibens]MBU8897922.1 AraC family transcriptional regulator [Citreicoccus inhibens]RJS21740.1 AraC family transcriptional regulator [Corallococcus sp. H22C18031201]